MGLKRPKGYKGKADELFSKIIRRPGRCLKCGSDWYLQCAHIISRRYAATRTDERNAWPLCAACHRRLTDWPVEHYEFILQTIGEEVYQELKKKAETVTKVDWESEFLRLKELDAQRTAEEMP